MTPDDQAKSDQEETAGKDPLTKAMEGAVQAHELFMTWVEAGFSEDQALALLAKIIKESGS